MNKVHTRASSVARRLVSNSGVSRLLCRFNRRSRILMLHGVGVPDYPPAILRAQLEFLVRVFRVVPLEDLLDADADYADSRPKLALTFDDGLKNNYTVAYPVLSQLRIPATFFVCPGLVETGRWLWNHECRARLERMSAAERRNFAEGLALEFDDIEKIVTRLKDLPHAERAAAEERLRLLTPRFVPTEAERLKYDMMVWEDIRSLDPALVSIGGHSTHHEILTRLGPDHLEREVAGCKRWLESALSRDVRHFCYPNGAYDDGVVGCVSRYFDAAVTTHKNWVPSPPSRFTLPRIPIAENMNDLAWRVHRPTG